MQIYGVTQNYICCSLQFSIEILRQLQLCFGVSNHFIVSLATVPIMHQQIIIEYRHV